MQRLRDTTAATAAATATATAATTTTAAAVAGAVRRALHIIGKDAALLKEVPQEVERDVVHQVPLQPGPSEWEASRAGGVGIRDGGTRPSATACWQAKKESTIAAAVRKAHASPPQCCWRPRSRLLAWRRLIAHSPGQDLLLRTQDVFL